MTECLYGIPVHTSPYCSKDKVFIIHSNWQEDMVIHPTTLLRMQYPRSPVWSTRTLGHREAARSKRLRDRQAT